MRSFVVSVFEPRPRGWLASWTVQGSLSNAKSSARSWWERDRILVVHRIRRDGSPSARPVARYQASDTGRARIWIRLEDR